jgi:hypothetical protein
VAAATERLIFIQDCVLAVGHQMVDTPGASSQHPRPSSHQRSVIQPFNPITLGQLLWCRLSAWKSWVFYCCGLAWRWVARMLVNPVRYPVHRLHEPAGRCRFSSALNCRVCVMAWMRPIVTRRQYSIGFRRVVNANIFEANVCIQTVPDTGSRGIYGARLRRPTHGASRRFLRPLASSSSKTRFIRPMASIAILTLRLHQVRGQAAPPGCRILRARSWCSEPGKRHSRARWAFATR